MEKLLLSTLPLFMAITGVHAEDTYYVLSQVDDTCYQVTDSLETLLENYPDPDGAVWGIGINIPQGSKYYDGENLTISAATLGWVYASNNRTSTEIMGVSAAINLGSNLGQQMDSAQVIEDITACYSKCQSILTVTPKKDGKLGMIVYPGANTRSQGIYKVPTETEMDNDNFGGWCWPNGYNYSRPESNDESVYVYTEVESGRSYYLLGGSNRNQSLAKITFVPNNSNGIKLTYNEDRIINNMNIFNLNGQRVTKNYKGIIIRNGKKLTNK